MRNKASANKISNLSEFIYQHITFRSIFKHSHEKNFRSRINDQDKILLNCCRRYGVAIWAVIVDRIYPKTTYASPCRSAPLIKSASLTQIDWVAIAASLLLWKIFEATWRHALRIKAFLGTTALLFFLNGKCWMLNKTVPSLEVSLMILVIFCKNVGFIYDEKCISDIEKEMRFSDFKISNLAEEKLILNFTR